MPESLKDAIKCFVLSLAVRESRIPQMEQSELFQRHNTMLIHISRFTFWQNTTRRLVDEYLKEIISRINSDNPSNKDSIYAELESTWYGSLKYAHIVENIKTYLPDGYEDEFMIPIVFDALKKFLPPAVKGIEVKAINSVTKEKLEYPRNSAKKIIAIGGNRLSRGFTLEGLTINYFTRVTNYSDGLLQMGRWFGYRPGYLDCCKIFTTQDSLDKFNSTTKCIEELEGEFKKMEEQGKDPQSFVLRVKKHPGTLRITRPSILKNAEEVRWSYQDSLEMTTKFGVKKEQIENVWDNFKMNIAPHFEEIKDDLLTFSADGGEVIKMLKNQPNNYDKQRINHMSMFIELCNEEGYLNDWTIALKVTGSSQQRSLSANHLNLKEGLVGKVKLARRSGPNKSEDDVKSFIHDGVYKASGKSANILSANSDMAILLSETKKEKAVENFYSYKTQQLQKKDSSLSYEDARAKAEKSTIPERYYREQMTDKQGLLIIYLFDSHYAFNQDGNNAKDEELRKKFEDYINVENIDLDIPLVGYAIGFPPMDDDPGGYYMQGDYELDTDEGEDEEGDEELPDDIN